MADQTALHRIHVHVVELFNSLLQTPYIEVVEAALPEPGQKIFAAFKGQFQLSVVRPPFAAQAPRDAQDLGNQRGDVFDDLSMVDIRMRSPIWVP